MDLKKSRRVRWGRKRGEGWVWHGRTTIANLGDSGHSSAVWGWARSHWETGHLLGNRTPGPYLLSNPGKWQMDKSSEKGKVIIAIDFLLLFSSSITFLDTILIATEYSLFKEISEGEILHSHRMKKPQYCSDSAKAAFSWFAISTRRACCVMET